MLAIILLAVSCLHVLAWSNHPPDVDPINFMAALQDYNISQDAPHPPGYPLYVALAKVTKFIVGPNHAFQLVNLAMVLITSVLLAVIGLQLGSRLAGSIAATLFAVHPLVWAATVIQECYVSDALGGAALVACGLAMGRLRYCAIVIFFMIVLGIGLLRPTSGLLLLPSGLVAIWLTTAADSHRWRLICLAAVAAVTALGAAYLVTVFLAGGHEIYRTASDRVMGDAFRANSLLGGAPFSAHMAMAGKLAVWFALWAAPLGFLAVLNRIVAHHGDWRAVGLLIAVWILPALGFYTFIYYLKPTYQIIFVPALCIGCGSVLATIAHNRSIIIVFFVGFITATGPGLFWFGTHRLPEPVYRLTHDYFIHRDHEWEKLRRAIAAAPDDCIIVHPKWSKLPPQALRLLTARKTYAILDPRGVVSINANGLWLEPDPITDASNECLYTPLLP